MRVFEISEKKILKHFDLQDNVSIADCHLTRCGSGLYLVVEIHRYSDCLIYDGKISNCTLLDEKQIKKLKKPKEFFRILKKHCPDFKDDFPKILKNQVKKNEPDIAEALSEMFERLNNSKTFDNQVKKNEAHFFSDGATFRSKDDLTHEEREGMILKAFAVNEPRICDTYKKNQIFKTDNIQIVICPMDRSFRFRTKNKETDLFFGNFCHFINEKGFARNFDVFINYLQSTMNIPDSEVKRYKKHLISLIPEQFKND